MLFAGTLLVVGDAAAAESRDMSIAVTEETATGITCLRAGSRAPGWSGGGSARRYSRGVKCFYRVGLHVRM